LRLNGNRALDLFGLVIIIIIIFSVIVIACLFVALREYSQAPDKYSRIKWEIRNTTWRYILTCVSHTASVIDIGWTCVCPSVRLSVCPSHAGIVSKRLNLSSNCLHCLVPHGSSFLRTKLFPEFQWVHPNGGVKNKGVEKSCNFRPISRYSS